MDSPGPSSMRSPRCPHTAHASTPSYAAKKRVFVAPCCPINSDAPASRPTSPTHHDVPGFSEITERPSPSPPTSGTPSESKVSSSSAITPDHDHDWYPWRHRTGSLSPVVDDGPCRTSASKVPPAGAVIVGVHAPSSDGASSTVRPPSPSTRAVNSTDAQPSTAQARVAPSQSVSAVPAQGSTSSVGQANSKGHAASRAKRLKDRLPRGLSSRAIGRRARSGGSSASTRRSSALRGSPGSSRSRAGTP